MKKLLVIVISFMATSAAFAERIEKIPFGDMETWVVRYITESKIIGGKTQTLYALGQTDTIRGNVPFTYGRNGNPWSMSDAYAVVSGIHKAAGTISPEKRGDGTCCRMDVKMLEVSVFGFIDIHVLVNGTIFWGRTIEPVKTAKDPYCNIDFGVPFTKRPSAIQLDYKCIVSPERWIWKATGLSASKKIDGHDECEVYLLLQKRWEDGEGKIHAKRVGTAYERIAVSHPEWENGHRIPVKYGDITKTAGYKDYMRLNNMMRAMNSHGKITPIEEEGWADANEKPTHAILMITSGCYPAFYGHEGNVMWVDNFCLVYDK